MLISGLRKIAIRFAAVKNVVRKEANRLQIKNDPYLLIKSLQRQGVDIADDTIIMSPETINIDLSRPSLISIGSGTRLNRNLEILTHDYTTYVFLKKFNAFVPSSGKVTIGKNVYFGRNVTCLKGTDIGDNCIIGFGSIVMGTIPANSVAVGCPARVICTLNEYFEKRSKRCVNEALEYSRSIQERYGRRPVPADFWEEFPLFVYGDEVEKYPEIPIKKQMKEKAAFENYVKNHKANYSSFDEFLKAAGL